MSDKKQPIQLLAETADTVTLRRSDFEALLEELEDAEDSNAVLQHDLEAARGDHKTPPLTVDEFDRLVTGENRVKVWRQKMDMTQRQLAEYAHVSQSQLAEIEKGTKTGSVDTLKKIAQALNISLDALTG
jgi:DNA-binding XRE family transcriptional regulator